MLESVMEQAAKPSSSVNVGIAGDAISPDEFRQRASRCGRRWRRPVSPGWSLLATAGAARTSPISPIPPAGRRFRHRQRRTAAWRRCRAAAVRLGPDASPTRRASRRSQSRLSGDGRPSARVRDAHRAGTLGLAGAAYIPASVLDRVQAGLDGLASSPRRCSPRSRRSRATPK